MIIKDVRVFLLRIPFVHPPKWSLRYDRPREVVVVEIETASGIVGMGYLMPLNGGMATIRKCLEELMIPHLIGENASDIEKIWQKLWRETHWVGRMGITVFAMSAVDIALWDIIGKHSNMPLHRLWGSFRSEIPAYAAGVWRGLGGEGMVEKAKSLVAKGFTAIKMQAGHLHDGPTDVSNVKRMREELGNQVDIMVDVNAGWTVDQAIHIGRKFEEFDVYWLEEPVVAEDFRGYLRIADAIAVRVVGGESHFTRFDLRPFLINNGIPILQPDVMRGGLSEMRKIAVVADTWGVQISPHIFHELMVHVMASIPNGAMLEYLDFMDDLWVDPVLPEKGTIHVPETPGHGLAFREEVLRDFAVKE